MANIVIDSSVVIKWFDPEPYTAEADRILAVYATRGLALLAPDILPAEVGNIIWKKQILLKRLTAREAQTILQKFQALSFTLTPTASLVDDAYHLAVAHRRTVYDALHLALSVQEQCPFVTADERFVNAVRSTFSSVVWLGDWQ